LSIKRVFFEERKHKDAPTIESLAVLAALHGGGQLSVHLLIGA
jgi:hypothetical protein